MEIDMDKEKLEDLVARLENIRVEFPMRQQELADAIGIGLPTLMRFLRKINNGARDITLLRIEKFIRDREKQ
jgi:transcriptional regulator with XRE-family HTH domain